MTFVRLCRTKVLALFQPVRKANGFFDRLKEGVMRMDFVSHADMYQYTLVLIGIASLIIAILNIKKK